MDRPTARVEHRRNDDLLGIGEARPRLSWVTATDAEGWRQTAYEIEITKDGDEPWSSGRIESAESVLVPWPAEPLGSRERRSTRVRTWGNGSTETDAGPSEWSEPVALETGLLGTSDWSARFVTPDWDDDAAELTPCPYLRHAFDLAEAPTRARLYVTALGVYEVEINGVRVGDHVLAPGWSSYRHRLRYETLDVTDLLRPGPNVIGVMLSDGWYRGTLGWEGKRAIYGDRLALLAQLEVADKNGATQVVGTDDSWRAGTGPLLRSGLYEGETYDARAELPGWSSAGYDDAGWTGVRELDHDLAMLVARVGPPVRRTEEVRPAEITTSPSGRTIVDFGQNLVGRLRLTLPDDAGPAGTTITLRHAEILQDGELCTEPLRAAEATDRYIVGDGPTYGDGATTWEPRFTFHGFRFAEVDGWPRPLTADDLVAVVCHSDMERTGWFECSDEQVNRLHRNIVWGMRGNFLDVPTDCPQRDERLGWTGDIQVFAPTACFLFDTAGFLGSWLAELEADQRADGAVPFVVPNSLKFVIAAAAWGDAATIVPWVVFQRSGDLGLLATQYDSMCAWVDHVVDQAGDKRLWDDGFQFGDWLDPHAPAENPFDGRTDVHLVASAYLCRSLDIVATTAYMLGKADDALRYRTIAKEVRAAFAREYVTPNGRVASDSQTAYALALEFDLLTGEAERRRSGTRLVELVEKAGHTIATGFVGTPLICDALCEADAAATAYRLLLQTKCPSWLYPVTQGATTVWERWDGLLPDGRILPGAMRMNSFNHYALGAIGDWLHRRVGGLAPSAPGYRQMRVAPVVDRAEGGLTWATSRHTTPYGPAESSWRLDGTTMEVTVVVPPNTGATVVLPLATDRPAIEVGSGRHQWTYEVSDESDDPENPVGDGDGEGGEGG